MAVFKSTISEVQLEGLNLKVKERGHIDREHLMEFLTLIPTNDAQVIIAEVQHWLQSIHDDPEYNRIVFPDGYIDSIIGDLDSYGRVRPENIYTFKQNSKMVPPMV